MGKLSNPKDVRKKLNQIIKKTRANNRRHKQKKNDINNPQSPHSNHNTNNERNKKASKKQHRGVWRCRKGGKRYYVGLDGKEYEGKEARHKCIMDKQALEKLAETKRQIQSPSFQTALNRNMNTSNIDISASLDRWQIPREIVQNYALKGITKLFEWQIECLSMLLNNNDGRKTENIIYSAPTSGGKTLISEILMIRNILLKRKKCILILPFVSLVIEKVNDLKSKLHCLGILVEAYHSNISINSIEDADIICCTIEKANSIINKMIEEGLIQGIGCLVIDEFHFIGDGHRGWILEILISKILFLLKDNVQIIGMSATLPNLQHIAEWMNAKLYITKNRPVTLTQYYKKGDVLYDGITKKAIRRLQQRHMKDREHVVTLCCEVTLKNSSVLVFCQKKIWCKQCCKMIAECLQITQSHKVNATINTKRRIIIEKLKQLPSPICDVLSVSILYGVAYHHAGLTLEEREIIENGFRKNVINILVATSTLAAGVNLPARRVIFRTPKIGRSFLSPSKYKQMAGRAGRKGIDLYGESIVICKDDSEANYVTNKLIDAPLEPITSQLLNKNNLQRFILEGFGTNLIKTQKDLEKYLNLSLQCIETDKIEWDQRCQAALNWLINNEFLQKTEAVMMDIDLKQNDIDGMECFDGVIEITNLGYATIGSGLEPTQSLMVFEEIAKTRKHGLYLTNSLHLCYLLSPIRNNGGNIEPHWGYYYECFMSLSKQKKDIADAVGISEKVLCDYAHNISHRPPYKSTNKTDIKYKRFYCSMILNKIIEEQSLYSIEKQFNIEGGPMQSLQSSAATFASSLSVFCLKLNWNSMAQIIAHFSQRLNYGVESELLPLMKISHMKAFRARILYNYGLTSIEAIVNASLETIILALSSESKFSVNDMQKKLIVNMAQKIKFEASTIHQRMQIKDQQMNDT